MEDYTTLTPQSPGLTQEALNKALGDWFKEDVTFTHWEYVGEPSKGDCYLSELIRIKIFGKDQNGQVKHVQAVLKTIPKNVCRRLTFRSDEFFKNEINFYNEVLSSLLKFQATKSLKEPFDNYAKVFFTYIDGINDCIVLEDVNPHGFGSALRQECIDLDHCKVTLRTFAKFHALSFAMKDQEPKEFERIRKCIFETYYRESLWPWYQRYWKRICGIAIDAVEREYPDSVYVQKVKEFAVPERYKDMCDAAGNTLESGVISHGDSWTNNFLFKYKNEVPENAIMIDFQLTRCASPVLDIAFFIYACTTEDMRVKHYEDLMKYYYDTLASQVREMGTDPEKVYSWERFREELKKYSFFGLGFSFESTPTIILDVENVPDMSSFTGEARVDIEDFWPFGPIKSQRGRLREANNVVHCVDNGVTILHGCGHVRIGEGYSLPPTISLQGRGTNAIFHRVTILHGCGHVRIGEGYSLPPTISLQGRGTNAIFHRTTRDRLFFILLLLLYFSSILLRACRDFGSRRCHGLRLPWCCPDPRWEQT